MKVEEYRRKNALLSFDWSDIRATNPTYVSFQDNSFCSILSEETKSSQSDSHSSSFEDSSDHDLGFDSIGSDKKEECESGEWNGVGLQSVSNASTDERSLYTVVTAEVVAAPLNEEEEEFRPVVPFVDQQSSFESSEEKYSDGYLSDVTVSDESSNVENWNC